ncbi:hypothetical protein A0256_05735 [Mucilaginibacter sp. PAMC 26640]|nr:hypothetical protein A0256_05735 [Mucilaginibacter sp. PAMC 26640]
MKTKILYLNLALLFVGYFGYGQKVPAVASLKFDQIYIVSNNHFIKLSDLKNSNITKFLGSPEKIKNEKWETNDSKNNKTYVYKLGELVLEDNQLSFIEINKKGWAFAFKNGKSLSAPITIGSSKVELEKLFPLSSKNGKNGLQVIIKTNTGKITESSLIFKYAGNAISSMELFTDES